MIEASIAAVPGLIVTFLVLAAIVAVPTALVAKARDNPWPLPVVLAVYIAGILAVTLLSGNAGLESNQCDTGAPIHLFTSASSLLNVALFTPGALLAVVLYKRPVTVAAVFTSLSATIELVQSVANLGRSCSVTDIAANATGAILGSVMGTLWLYWRRQQLGRPVRDLLWGSLLAVVGTIALVGFFQSRIQSVDVVAKDDQRHDRAEAAIQADEWITGAAKGIFGADTQTRETATEKDGNRLKITAETNHGSISGWWPQKDLERAWSSNTRGDEGNLSEKQVAAAADDFARKWFPKDVVGSKQRIRTLGDGPTRAYAVVYRRYTKDGVMMPMRLDLTITTTGRVIGFVAKTVDDPSLERVKIDEAEARALVRNVTGLPADKGLLLAQQVKGEWRPVWLIGSGKEDIAIDAATGARVTVTDY
ncbi:VanZ family protein [Streptomyces sp. DG2A-72]|uniref:VanZ family protein n=1 Tax=Streptomyces sp. DG2A-72 TaxID=3051386 RepID=UPI00265C7EA6|nr:VanZ family protein [Streptomyces sp. DG2A-72]MDO0933117.1 VanZ family protein [Streptomyces sp. DG2A-72]